VTLIRHLVMARLRAQFAAVLAADSVTNTVQVVLSPATEMPSEWVQVAAGDQGDVSRPSMKPGGSWDDRWTMTVTVSSSLPGSSLEESEGRASTIVDTLTTWLRPSYALISPEPIAGLVSVVVVQILGPDSGSFTNGDHGYGTSYRLVLEGHSRIC
jgi:hypothetical protein